MKRGEQEAILRAYCVKIMGAFNETRWYRSPETSHFEHPVLPEVWFAGLLTGVLDVQLGGKLSMHYTTKEAAIEDAVKGHPGLKPWPRDALMIVAARAGEAILQHMADIHPCTCRDCDAVLHADTRSTDTARGILKQRGVTQEIRFFCRDCILFYIPTPVAVDGRGKPV